MTKSFFSTSKALLPTLLLCALGQCLPAQNLHLYYNLFTDSIYYLRNNHPVARPKIHKGDRIVVHFTEFNPYLYDAKVQVVQTEDESTNGSSSIGAFQQLVPGMGAFLPKTSSDGDGDEVDSSSTGTNGISFLDIPLFQLGSKSIQLKDLFSNARGSEQILNLAQAQLQELAAAQADMQEIYAEIQDIKTSESAGRVALAQIDPLLTNPNLRPSLIQQIGFEYRDLVFPKKKSPNLQVNDAFVWQNLGAEKQRLLVELTEKQRIYEAKSAKLAPIAQQITDLELGSADLAQFSSDLNGLGKQAAHFKQQVEAFVGQERAEKEAGAALTLDDILGLHLKFREIADQRFQYETVVEVAKESITLEAVFAPLDTLADGRPQKGNAPKTKTLRLEANSGMKINTAAGLAFGFLGDNSTYSVKDGVIVAEQNGNLAPALTSFIHFHPKQRRDVGVSGTFGIGIPLKNGDLQNVQFFLGPSLLLGSNQRVVLSAGAVVGPVQRLAKGYAAGDAFDLNLGDIPLRKSYTTGWFLGISFVLR